MLEEQFQFKFYGGRAFILVLNKFYSSFVVDAGAASSKLHFLVCTELELFD